MWHRRIGILIFCWLLGVGAMARAEGWTIEPGRGIGPITIGSPYQAVEKSLRRDPQRAAEQVLSGGRPVYAFYAEGLQVHYDVDGRALQIVAERPGMTTVKGLAVGDPLARVQALYGAAYVSHQLPTARGLPQQVLYAYKGQGLSVQTEGDRVTLIYVYAPLP